MLLAKLQTIGNHMKEWVKMITSIGDAQGGKGSATLSMASADAELSKFGHELTGASVESIDVPVVGGRTGATILPLFPN